MRWLVTLGIAILSAALGLVAAGLVASLAVDWYRISSFEGNSGFFVVGMALLGGLAGLVIGVVASLVMAARSQPGFLKGLGASVLAILVIAGATAGVARFLADVPPTIDGEELLLVAELRWPVNAANPPDPKAVGTVMLGSLSGNTVRVSRDGPLLFEDARQDDGRWIVPGAVPVFTARGRRTLHFRIGDEPLSTIDVPLPGHPGADERTWSDWLPAAGAAPQSTPFTYRYKVVRVSEPFREQRVGRFTVSTASREFFMSGESRRLAARSRFTVKYDGTPIAGLEPLESLAVVAGQPALVGRLDFHSQDCVLIVDAGQAATVRKPTPCWLNQAQPMTSDTAFMSSWRTRDEVPGWLDTGLLSAPGLYKLGPAVLDTRTLAVTEFEMPDEPSPVQSLPPLGLSPDEHSFVWFSDDSYRHRSTIGVTDWTNSRSYTLPVDRARMRFVDFMLLDPAWLQHHFEWQRGLDARDVLVERKGFVPLPYTGKLTLAKAGESQLYWLEPAGAKLRDAVVALLVDEYKAERVLEAADAYEVRVKLDGRVIGVSNGSSYVAVSLDAANGDPEAMKGLATRLEASFATGRFDALFVSDEKDPE